MRVGGFGCLGCGGLVALAGALALVAALVPGVVNSSETGTAIGIGGGLCGASLFPVLIGVILLVVGGKKGDDE